MHTLRSELERAAAGLLYTSESDRPLAWFFLPGGASGWPYGADEFARRLGAGGARAEEWTLDAFLARHIEESDPLDPDAQHLRPRYQALREALRGGLDGVRVFRVGSEEVRCFAVGADGQGNLAGVETVAVET